MKSYLSGISSEGLAGNTLVPGEGLLGSYSSSQSLTACQKKMTAIAGYVLDVDGAALTGITVELYDSSGQLISSTTTDEFGFYYFLDVDVSEFEIRVIYNDQTYVQFTATEKWELVMVIFVI